MTASAPAGSEAPLLQVANLHAFYGKSHVLHGVDLQIRKGEIVSLLGRNGVGRSTTARSIIGLVDCTGSVRFRGEEMVGRKAFEIANRGIGYVPEDRLTEGLFLEQSIGRNIIVRTIDSLRGSFGLTDPQQIGIVQDQYFVHQQFQEDVGDEIFAGHILIGKSFSKEF